MLSRCGAQIVIENGVRVCQLAASEGVTRGQLNLRSGQPIAAFAHLQFVEVREDIFGDLAGLVAAQKQGGLRILNLHTRLHA